MNHCNVHHLSLWATRTVPPCCISPYGPLALSHHAVHHPMDHSHCSTMLYITLWTTRTVPPCCVSPYGPLALSHHAVYHPMDHSHCSTMLCITLWTTRTVPPCCISPYGPLALSHHAVYHLMGHYCTENITQHSLSCQDKKYHQYLLVTFSHIFKPCVREPTHLHLKLTSAPPLPLNIALTSVHNRARELLLSASWHTSMCIYYLRRHYHLIVTHVKL